MTPIGRLDASEATDLIDLTGEPGSIWPLKFESASAATDSTPFVGDPGGELALGDESRRYTCPPSNPTTSWMDTCGTVDGGVRAV